MKNVIRTRKLDPTASGKGTRVKATDSEGNTVTVPWQYGFDSHANHMAACDALLASTQTNAITRGGQWDSYTMYWVEVD